MQKVMQRQSITVKEPPVVLPLRAWKKSKKNLKNEKISLDLIWLLRKAGEKK